MSSGSYALERAINPLGGIPLGGTPLPDEQKKEEYQSPTLKKFLRLVASRVLFFEEPSLRSGLFRPNQVSVGTFCSVALKTTGRGS